MNFDVSSFIGGIFVGIFAFMLFVIMYELMELLDRYYVKKQIERRQLYKQKCIDEFKEKNNIKD